MVQTYQEKEFNQFIRLLFPKLCLKLPVPHTVHCSGVLMLTEEKHHVKYLFIIVNKLSIKGIYFLNSKKKNTANNVWYIFIMQCYSSV